jgi:hypothetical protein
MNKKRIEVGWRKALVFAGPWEGKESRSLGLNTL